MMAFVGLYFGYLRPLFLASGADIGRNHWSGGFPPLAEPWKLLTWFFSTHAGHMLAYPIGGGNGRRSLTAPFFFGANAVPFPPRNVPRLAYPCPLTAPC